MADYIKKEKAPKFTFDSKRLGYDAVTNDETFDQSKNNGKFHSRFVEPIPGYDAGTGETVYSGNNNNWIVLGRDRPSTKESGYGALGIPRAGTIDIVVGRGGSRPSSVGKGNKKIFVDNNFMFDSARIYVSQKTDVDKNFLIASDNTIISENCSAIAAKADSIRIMGRRDIKIVTGTEEKDSNGLFVDQNPAIYLIGNNDDTDVQPMVKGENLQACLVDLIEEVNKLNGTVTKFLTLQNRFNNAIIGHTHLSPFYGKPVSKSPQLATNGLLLTNQMMGQVKTSLMANVANMTIIRSNYLERFDEGANNILSDYVFCN